jgi:hypothetical protein
MKKLFLILFMTTVVIWANIGNIMVVKGQADVKRSTKLLTAKNGMLLLVGDEIITKTQSRVQVMLKDDTVITIGPKSSFAFDDFVFDGTTKSKISLKSNRGFFRSVTGKISKIAPERFKVKTVSATIGIRGTDFSGEITGDTEIIKCYKGTIYVEFEGISRDIEAGNLIELGDSGVKLRKNISVIREPKKLIYDNKETNGMSNEVISDITQEKHHIEDKLESTPESKPIVKEPIVQYEPKPPIVEDNQPTDKPYPYDDYRY